MSYGEAYHIINGLKGETAPRSWQGGLNTTYNFGDGSLKINLNLQINNIITVAQRRKSDEKEY